MVFEEVERLQREYTDKYVVVDAQRPELARFADYTGIVKTINYNGRALVEFLDFNSNIGWFDIGLDYIKIVPKPDPNAKKAEKEKPAAKAAPAAKSAPAKPAAAKTAAKPAGGKMSTADILAKLRQMGPVGSGGGTASAKPAAEGEAAEAPVAAPAKKAAAPKKAPAAKPAGALPTTTAEKIEWCRQADAGKA